MASEASPMAARSSMHWPTMADQRRWSIQFVLSVGLPLTRLADPTIDPESEPGDGAIVMEGRGA